MSDFNGDSFILGLAFGIFLSIIHDVLYSYFEFKKIQKGVPKYDNPPNPPKRIDPNIGK